MMFRSMKIGASVTPPRKMSVGSWSARQAPPTSSGPSARSDFPRLFSRRYSSSLPLRQIRIESSAVVRRFEESAEIARALRAKWDLGLSGGMVIANPVPPEFEADPATIEMAISLALDEAGKAGITGKRITPYLLEAIARVTCGKSLAANIALIKNNASLAAGIACSLKP